MLLMAFLKKISLIPPKKKWQISVGLVKTNPVTPHKHRCTFVLSPLTDVRVKGEFSAVYNSKTALTLFVNLKGEKTAGHEKF